MDIPETLKIMRTLANGADPETGENLDATRYAVSHGW